MAKMKKEDFLKMIKGKKGKKTDKKEEVKKKGKDDKKKVKFPFLKKKK